MEDYKELVVETSNVELEQLEPQRDELKRKWSLLKFLILSNNPSFFFVAKNLLTVDTLLKVSLLCLRSSGSHF